MSSCLIYLLTATAFLVVYAPLLIGLIAWFSNSDRHFFDTVAILLTSRVLLSVKIQPISIIANLILCRARQMTISLGKQKSIWQSALEINFALLL
ncbi:hypothetical protein EV426DRAFT_608317 [Tirmania nivea]|nr:hypothetical protein EV426DRAFT_608317 [Tirmania nivea]